MSSATSPEEESSASAAKVGANLVAAESVADSGILKVGGGSHEAVEEEGRSGFRFNFSFRLSKLENRREGEEKGRKLISSPVSASAREVSASEGIDGKKFASEAVSLQRGLVLWKGRVSSSDLLGISQSDLVPGKYEGGFKLWECTIDLIEALRREIQDARLTFRGKNVLELGCGHGLPGILAVLKGAACVHFQDYNVEVLTHLTIPNVKKNISQANSRQRRNSEGVGNMRSLFNCDIHYFAGDWADMGSVLSSAEFVMRSENRGRSLAEDVLAEAVRGIQSLPPVLVSDEDHGEGGEEELAPEDPGRSPTRGCHGRTFSRANEIAIPGRSCSSGGYDVILMSETVYSPVSMPKLLDIIKKCLRPPYGVVYVAGKKHYFGVGGGTRQFKSLVVEDGVLSGHLVAEFVDGSSNMREIWKFFFPLQRQRA